MYIIGKKVMVIGGAGFVGSHIVDELLTQDVEQVVVYDNFVRGTGFNLQSSSDDKRLKSA